MNDIPSPVIEVGVAQAQSRSAQARSQFIVSLMRLKNSLMPGVIAHKLVDAVTAKALKSGQATVEKVRERPAAAIGMAALIALFFARRPIARALSSRKRATPKPRTRSPAKRIRKAKPS